jgi:hypothetical protein
MELVWCDGGRASCGFVGLVGDCVVRSIAIATGGNYRDLYVAIGKASEKTPRGGVATTIAAEFLSRLGWRYTEGQGRLFDAASVPHGVVIVHLSFPDSPRKGHFCTVIDHVIHDTWNPSDEEDYVINGFWTCDLADATPGGRLHFHSSTGDARHVQTAPACNEQVLTQKEFERILHRLRSLENTAKNHASTEGEKRNALRMMQNLMLRHNLSREDITEDDNLERMSFSKMACPVSGRRAHLWEKSLAAYLTKEIFPMTAWYLGTKGNRTLFWFFGPVEDVQNCIALFRELLVTIAASAQLRYGGHTRGSGASYAEGYVRGLPRHQDGESKTSQQVSTEYALIHTRVLAVRDAALDWLRLECGITLSTSRRSGRDQHDPNAAALGKKHGSTHDLAVPRGPKRIATKP